MSINILFISNTGHSIGGAQQALFTLLRKLINSPFKPFVILPHDGSLKVAIEEMNIITFSMETDYLWFPNKKSYFKYLQELPTRIQFISEIIQHYNIELVHTYDMFAFDGALAAYYTKKPHIWHAHSRFGAEPHPLFQFTQIGFEEWASLLDNFSDRIIAVSEGVKLSLINSGVNKLSIEVIYNGIDKNIFNITEKHNKATHLKEEFGLPANSMIVTCIGRISKIKNMGALIDAASLVLNSNSNTHFFIIGPEEDHLVSQTLKNKIKERDLCSSVTFTGPRTDILNILMSSDILVSTSLSEGLPLTFLEAMCTHTPIVAMRYEGIDEIIDSSNGIVVDSGNIRALADAIIAILEDDAFRQSLAENSYKKIVDNFDSEVCLVKQMSLYRGFVNKPSKSSGLNYNYAAIKYFVSQQADFGSLGLQVELMEQKLRVLEKLETRLTQNVFARLFKKMLAIWH